MHAAPPPGALVPSASPPSAQAGLVAVHLVSPEAARIAHLVLPQSSTIDATEEKPYLSVLYLSMGDAQREFGDPLDASLVLQVQTLAAGVPTRPSGQIATTQFPARPECPPTMLEQGQLTDLVLNLAAAALLGKYWPTQHNSVTAKQALCGWTMRGGKDTSWIAAFGEMVVVAACGLADPQRRLREAVETKQRLEQGKPTRGFSTLVKILPPRVVDQVSIWLEIAPRVRAHDISDQKPAIAGGSGDASRPAASQSGGNAIGVPRTVSTSSSGSPSLEGPQARPSPITVPRMPPKWPGGTPRSTMSLSRCLYTIIESKYGALVASEGRVWIYDESCGIFRAIPEEELLKAAASAEGMECNEDADPKERYVSLGSGLAKDIVRCLKLQLQESGFFDDTVPGVVFGDLFLRVDMKSTTMPFRRDPHSRDHRARCALPVSLAEVDEARLEGSLLERYWKGLFPKDEEGDVKRAIMQEGMGVTLLGIATRIPEGARRALALWDESNGGKSTFLRLLEGLVASTAIVHISPSGLRHEYQRAALAGKLLNTVDEIKPDATIAAEFKAVVRGEPIQARVVCQEPFFFRPVAFNAFGINASLNWKDAFDSGVANRLIQISFDKPAENPIENIAEKIVARELPLLVRCALDGAKRMSEQGWTFTRLTSSEELAQEQVIEGDPMMVWVSEMVTLDAQAPPIAVEEARSRLEAWAEGRRIRGSLPMGKIGFGRAFLRAVRKIHQGFDAGNPSHGKGRSYRGVCIASPPMGPKPQWPERGSERGPW